MAQAANALTELGVKPGDRVAIYLPMIPEAAIAMLACARIGAPHSVVFGGFSAEALRSRIEDARGKARHHCRRRLPPRKANGAQACSGRSGGRSLQLSRSVLVVQRTKQDIDWRDSRDVWWHDIVGRQSDEHTRPSDSTASTHCSSCTHREQQESPRASCTRRVATSPRPLTRTHNVFDHKPASDVYWCTADVGWVTGHSYIVYGPLANGATQVMYEGTPDTPHQGRWWEIVEKYGVTLLYTAPTAIRTFMKWGDDVPDQFDLSSLRLLGSVGEPINPEAWIWYREHIGGGRTPVVDTWWQTETGGIMISPLPGVTASKPGSAMRPLPGISGGSR